MTIRALARPEIQNLRPYEAAAQVNDTIRLNANESPWTNGADHFARSLNRYPEVRPAALQIALARRFACEPLQLLPTRGSSEGIDLLIRAFCRPGMDNIVTTAPTFTMYRHYAEIQSAAVHEVLTERDNDFSIDIDAVLSACDDETRLIFICTPNNPTGTVLPRADLVELLEQRADRSVIVVDEAYIEFAGLSSAVDLIAKHDNLVVLRTLSKALAFAGARCGAVIGPKDVIDILDPVQAPYAFSTPVVECVLEALQDVHVAELERRCAKIITERDRVMKAMRQFPSVQRVWPSAANFFLVHLNNAEEVLRQSEKDKILLRYFGGALSDCVRISVGSPVENDELLRMFSAIRTQTQ